MDTLQRMRDLVTLNCEWDVIKLLPWAQGTMQNRIHAHMNWQRLKQHEKGLYKFKPDKFLMQRERSGHEPPSLIKKLYLTNNHLQRKKNSFFQRRVTGYINHA